MLRGGAWGACGAGLPVTLLWEEEQARPAVVTYRAAGQVVPVQVVLQQAGKAQVGQAELLEAVLDGLGGPHAGAQLGKASTVTPHQ